MPVEVEVKIKVDDFEDIEYKLLERGALLEEIVMQRDHYFQHPSKDFNKTDEALRIREDGDRFYLTYKFALCSYTGYSPFKNSSSMSQAAFTASCRASYRLPS